MAKSEVLKIRVKPKVKKYLEEVAVREENTLAEQTRIAIDYYLAALPGRKRGA